MLRRSFCRNFVGYVSYLALAFAKTFFQGEKILENVLEGEHLFCKPLKYVNHEGEYFYVYLDTDSEMKETEKFFGQPFDYAFPLRDEVPTTAWVGLLKIEE